MKNNIRRDLKIGNVGEQIVREIFSRKWNVNKNTGKNLSDYDLLCSDANCIETFTIEVKYDVYSEKSGNIAVEFHNCENNKPSGIDVTKADLWAHVTPNQGTWICKVSALREYIKSNKPFKTITGVGDGNASIYLYKAKSILPELFIRCDNLDLQNLIKTVSNLLK